MGKSKLKPVRTFVWVLALMTIVVGIPLASLGMVMEPDTIDPADTKSSVYELDIWVVNE